MHFVKTTRLNSLRLKVLLAYLGGTVLSIVLLVATAVITLQSTALARMDLAGLAEDMASRIRFDELGRPVDMAADEDGLAWVYDSLRRETAYRVLDSSGKVALLSSAGERFWPTSGSASRLAPGRFDFKLDGAMIYGATEVVEHAGNTWYLQVAASTRLMTLLHRVALPLVADGILVFSLVMLLAFGLCVYITLGYALKPLRDVSETAAAISPRSIHARLRTDDVPSEIVPLVDSFNRLLERLERGYRVQQEFLGHAAHELKTPLALIRAQIELKEHGDRDRAILLGDVEYMTRQVQQLLLLAEASEPHNYHFAAVRVKDVADEAAAYLRRMAEAAQVRLAISAPAGEVEWQADRSALFTLLKNLMENAIQHAPMDTDVTVEILRGEMAVRDVGPGVDAVQLSLLFERFWRAAHRRDRGAGLGLAICQEIASAHGWSLAAEQAEPGLRFRLSVKTDSQSHPIDSLLDSLLGTIPHQRSA